MGDIMDYRTTAELLDSKLKPIIDKIEENCKHSNDIRLSVNRINGTVTQHEKDIKKAVDHSVETRNSLRFTKKIVRELKEEELRCPVKSGHVDVVKIYEETGWIRTIGRSRWFFFVIVAIIAFLSGFPNWMNFLGISYEPTEPVVIEIKSPEFDTNQTPIIIYEDGTYEFIEEME